jgi:predicted O-methyltransferase YrrM
MNVYREASYSALIGVVVGGLYAVSAQAGPLLGTTVALLCAVALVVFVLLYSKTMLSALLVQTQASSQLSHLSFSTVVPWSSYALQPTVAARLLHEIQFRKATHIVECGSGVSTILIAKVLAGLGRGHLYSIEHSAVWADYVMRLLKANHLEPYVTLIHAELLDGRIGDREVHWYDSSAIRAAIPSDTEIDVLLVDGPPHKSASRARLPALPFFASHLVPGALIVLDDLHRRDEQEIANLWIQQYGLTGGERDRDQRSGFFSLEAVSVEQAKKKRAAA